jgi:hypothetical protein
MMELSGVAIVLNLVSVATARVSSSSSAFFQDCWNEKAGDRSGAQVMPT